MVEEFPTLETRDDIRVVWTLSQIVSCLRDIDTEIYLLGLSVTVTESLRFCERVLVCRVLNSSSLNLRPVEVCKAPTW